MNSLVYLRPQLLRLPWRSVARYTTDSRWQAIRSAKPFSEFLTDTFDRKHDYLRISITERCNLRCRQQPLIFYKANQPGLYCMPEEGVDLSPPDHLLTTDEILRLARLFVSQGVTKIRLTGGEPTVRKDILDLVTGLGEIPGLKELCMTSNGISLHRKLPALRAAGLTALNLSLDTLVDGKFTIMTRRQGLSHVLKSLQTALDVGVPKVKLNVVVMRGLNEDEVPDFVALTKDRDIEVRFIEYMPFDGNKWSTNKMVPFREIEDMITDAGYSLEPIAAKPGDTAKSCAVAGHLGRVGFITSMTSHFCSSCTRLRITCDGNLKVCLFGNAEVSLRDLLRANVPDEELLTVIARAVKNKKAQHAGIGTLEKMKNRPMILIGG